MVQLMYYEQRGACCRRVMDMLAVGSRTTCRVLLFPDEGCTECASARYLLVSRRWPWSKTRWRVREVVACTGAATGRSTGKARLEEDGRGTMRVSGSFKRDPLEPDFVLELTSHVSEEDFQRGYALTGTVLRGDTRNGNMYVTHYAMISRKAGRCF